MKRHLIIAGALWVALTAAGEALALLVDFYPIARSDKGEEIERAFRILVIMAVPVFTMVVAVLVYSVLARRTAGPLAGEGPPLLGRGAVPVTWFALTAGLTFLVMIYPGLTSLQDVVGNYEEPDLVVDVQGVQWTWLISYPQYDVTAAGELVLPVDRTVRFDITSLDVLHSFWVPAFLMKIDAVPGRPTKVSLKPTTTGSFDSDPLLRVQCAELCGLSHSRMRVPVRVVSEQEFEDWVKGRQEAARTASAAQPTVAAEAQTVAIAAKDLAFDTKTIAVESGRQVVIKLDNQDANIPHNWALYESEEAAASAATTLASGPIQSGPVQEQILFDPLQPGTYFFRCDVHPTTMTGELVVK